MSIWHRMNPEKPLDQEPYYWRKVLTGAYKETLGSFTIECPRCHWKGDYGSIGGEIRCEECKSFLPLKDQIITERKKKEDDKESV